MVCSAPATSKRSLWLLLSPIHFSVMCFLPRSWFVVGGQWQVWQPHFNSLARVSASTPIPSDGFTNLGRIGNSDDVNRRKTFHPRQWLWDVALDLLKR